MIFLNLFNRLIKRKDVYFKYSTSEQFTGEYWLDGKKIYTKTVKYDANNTTNISTDVNLGLSNANEIWIDYQNSFVYFSTDECSGPLFIVSKSGWFGIYTYLTNLKGNIKLNIQANSNTKVNRVYITVKYTKTTD